MNMDTESLVPRITVTVPSPTVQTTAVSVAGTTGPNSETPQETARPEATAVTVETQETARPEATAVTVETQETVRPEATAVTVETTEVPLDSEKESTGEFAAAEECGGCAVNVSEQQSQSVQTTAGTSEPDQDDEFRNAPAPEFYPCARCMEVYERIWRVMHNGYAIPVWIMLLALPLSAGVIGALYMYSCPASHAITTLMFTMGVSLMALISLKVCYIIYEMTSENLSFRNMLHTLQLTATFLTTLFFLTESVAFWQMDSSSHPGTQNYCDPFFTKFAFWWNIVMSFVIVPLFLFPL